MLKKHITRLKRLEKYDHLNQLGSQAVQDIVIRIEKNYQLFFKSLKSTRRGRVSPPGYKKRRKYKSFTFTQAGYKILDGNRIRIGSRIFRYYKSRDIEGIVKTLTIKREALGDIYLLYPRIPHALAVGVRQWKTIAELNIDDTSSSIADKYVGVLLGGIAKNCIAWTVAISRYWTIYLVDVGHLTVQYSLSKYKSP
jgi:hypothetical protein